MNAASSVRVAGVHAVVIGNGRPITLFAHGLGGSSEETRPLASAVPGTRVLLDFRDHGLSDALEAGWNYELLADDLLGIADHVGAERALGLSLGAGALLRALARDEQRFARLAFVLPAAVDRPLSDARRGIASVADAATAGDVTSVTGLLLDHLPDRLRGRRDVQIVMRRRASALLEHFGPSRSLDESPVADLTALASIRTPSLVLAQRGDSLHPVDVARRLHQALPRCQYEELPPGGVFWACAEQAQHLIARHLAA